VEEVPEEGGAVTHEDRTRIQVEVMTGQPPEKGEPAEARAYRLEMMAELREAKERGDTLDMPDTEWD
jgi:hypothetical protein